VHRLWILGRGKAGESMMVAAADKTVVKQHKPSPIAFGATATGACVAWKNEVDKSVFPRCLGKRDSGSRQVSGLGAVRESVSTGNPRSRGLNDNQRSLAGCRTNTPPAQVCP
jgi:hypothetical protein